MSPRNYLIGFGALLALLLAATALFNRVVDPFWYFRDTTIPGFNDVKKQFALHERQVKPFVMQKEQPAVLIFGNSYSEIGFDPTHPALRAIGTSYNLALAGTPWPREYCMVRFAIAHDPRLREIIVGIHPKAMPATDCAGMDAEMENPDLLAFLLSYSALEASVDTLSAKTPTHTAGGMMFYERGKPGTAARFHTEFRDFLPRCDIGAVAADKDAARRNVQDVDLGGLRDLLHEATAHGIRVKLVIYPLHALALEQFYACALMEQRWHVLGQEAALAAEAPPGQVELWNFEGYHDIGTEPISDAPDIWWQDSGHFNKEFGDIMLSEMYGTAPVKYGAHLTPDNMARYEAAQQQARAAYIAAHPEFMQAFRTYTPGPR